MILRAPIELTLTVLLLGCSRTIPAEFRHRCPQIAACPEPVAIPDSSIPSGTVIGTVVGWGFADGSRPARVAGALVSTARTRAQTTTHKDGTFSLTLRDVGDDTLTVRFIGFSPAKVPLTLTRNGGTRVLVPIRVHVFPVVY